MNSFRRLVRQSLAITVTLNASMRRKWQTYSKRTPNRAERPGNTRNSAEDSMTRFAMGKSQWSWNDSLGIPLVKYLSQSKDRIPVTMFPEKFQFESNDRTSIEANKTRWNSIVIWNSVNAFVVSSLDRVCSIFKHPEDGGKTTTSSVIIVHAYATIGDAADRITFYLTDRGNAIFSKR